jgi:glycogen synthase
MRVLLIGPYPPPQGGIQTNLVSIRRFLLEREIPCQVINLTRYRQKDHDGIYFPSNGLEVFLLLARLPFTIVHVHIGGNLTPRLLLLALACTLLPNAKTVLTLHSGGYPSSEEGRASHRRTFRAFVFRRIHRLIAVNEQLRRLFVEQFGVAAERVHLILPHSLPAGIPNVALPDEVEQFFSSHQPVFLSMGWLEPEYDYSLQIRALGLVRQSYPRAGLLILGEGRLRPQLEQEIAAASCPEDVLLAGDLPHEIALAAMARPDLFLRTTHYDGDSISVREALHFGTPVIASDTGLRPDGVRLVPMRDEEALVGAILAQLKEHKPPRRAPEAHEENIAAIHHLYENLSESL